MKITEERAREILVANFNGGIQIGTFGDTAVAAILLAAQEERAWWCELVCPDCGSGNPKTETAGVPHCPDCGRIQVKGTRIVRAEFNRREKERG